MPDIGDFTDVPVIEIFVKVGETIAADAPLVALESDKATMEVPASTGGVAGRDSRRRWRSSPPGARCPPLPSRLQALRRLLLQEAAAPAFIAGDITRPTDEEPTTAPPHVRMPTPAELANSNGGQAHASPSVRQFARELGADINKIPGTGPKNRITKEDVQAYIKGVLSASRLLRPCC